MNRIAGRPEFVSHVDHDHRWTLRSPVTRRWREHVQLELVSGAVRDAVSVLQLALLELRRSVADALGSAWKCRVRRIQARERSIYRLRACQIHCVGALTVVDCTRRGVGGGHKQ